MDPADVEDAAGSVLVIEDDASLIRVLLPALTARGYWAQLATTGEEGLRATASLEPDIVILDLGLPDLDGLEVCERLRRWYQNPIVVLSADGSVDRKVEAFALGANDYITKPFSTPELLARLRAAMRHRALRVSNETITIGDLTLDVAAHQVAVANVPVDLTRRELQLLALLARNVGKMVPYRLLLEHLWGADDDRFRPPLRTLVNQVRRKMGEGPDRPVIDAERGVGYRLTAPPS